MNKKVTDLKPGDRISSTVIRTITETRLLADSVCVVYDDGTMQTWELSGDPTIPVVDA